MAKRTKSTTTAVALNDEQLRQFAQAYVETERSVATGAFFGLRGGILTYEGAPVTDNKMCVVIVDYILENAYFAEAFDADTITPPKCYAYGRNESEMAPHQMVLEAGHSQAGQSGKCHDCRHNAFGSADVGKGKACGNRRRLALIPAGTYKDGKLTLFTKPEQFQAPLAYLKLPVTSVKDFSAYVKQVATLLGVPPFGVLTTIAVVPDAKSQFKVQFHVQQKVTDLNPALLSVIMQRHEEAKQAIVMPYPAYQEATAEEKSKRKSATVKKGRKY